MSLKMGWLREARFGFPRVSGDEPRLGFAQERADKFSPRERG